MMKEEFEGLLGEEVSLSDYEAIESVYVTYERFPDKQSIVNFYKAHGMEGVNALMEPIKKVTASEEQISAIRAQIEALKAKMDILNDSIKKDAIVYGFTRHWTWSATGVKF